MPAAWVFAATGVDPAADLRGTYSTQAGAQRALLASGGMAALWADLAHRAGLEPVQGLRRGDVGVIKCQVTATARRDVGAIFLGHGMWATVGQSGGILACKYLPPCPAWSFQ